MAYKRYILLRSKRPLNELTGSLAQLLGIRFLKSNEVDWDLYIADAVGVEIRIYNDLNFEDDQGIEFSKYNVAMVISGYLSFNADAHYEDWLSLLPIFFAEAIHRNMGIDCMVVEDLQTVKIVLPDPKRA